MRFPTKLKCYFFIKVAIDGYLLTDLGVHAQLVGAREGSSAAAAREGTLARVSQLVTRQVRRALEPEGTTLLV